MNIAGRKYTNMIAVFSTKSTVPAWNMNFHIWSNLFASERQLIYDMKMNRCFHTIKMFPYLLALLFILKIRLSVQSNILELIKKRYGKEGKKLFRTYEADDVDCFGETF